MFHLQERQYDQRCVDPEFLRSLFSEHKRLPWMVRRHIHSCEACQEACAEIHEGTPIQKEHFGKPFETVAQKWFGAVEQEKGVPHFFEILGAAVKKYGAVLYVSALAGAVFAIVKTILSSG